MNPAVKFLEVVIITLGGVWQGIRQDFNLLELAAIAVAVYAWRKRDKTSKGWRLLRGVPAIRAWRRPGWIAAGIVLAAVALRVALIPVLPVPVPIVTDEFSHLLLADTLAHGRVANPTHAFWQHFESIHIIQQPHYVSNYFPGHALFLAAGKIALASSWAGVLAEYALFLAALYWALRGWMPSRWALVGIVLAAVRFGIASYWIDAYHGGFLPALGGALIFGAFPRLRKNVPVGESAGLGLIFGAGLAILAATRPFEGLAYALPFAAVLFWEKRKNAATLVLASAAACAVAFPALAGLGMYFQHVTGSPFVTAYQVSQKTYGWPVQLAAANPPKIEFRHVEMQRYYEYEISERGKIDGPVDFVEFLTFRLQEYWRFFFGPLLTIPLLMLGRVWRRRPMLLVAALGAIAAVLMEGASPHYLAPATAALVAIVVEGCRYFDGLRIRLAPVLIAAMAFILVLRIGLEQAGLPYTQKLNFQSWCCRVEGDHNKARMIAELDRIPGEHLVFVKAKTDPANLFQWIYNDADIDASRIVWARDMGEERNAELEKYFAGRKVWMVNPNIEPASVAKYEADPSDGVTASRQTPLPPR
jgi:hypothetical protein